MTLKFLKQIIFRTYTLCLIALTPSFAIAHESADITFSSLSAEGVLHLLLQHQGLLFTVSTLLTLISVRVFLLKRKKAEV